MDDRNKAVDSKAEQEALLKFPCSFPIKVIGRMQQDLEEIVLSIIKPHINRAEPEKIQSRISGKGNYQSVTITIVATSKTQMDAIYLSLNQHSAVLMTL